MDQLPALPPGDYTLYEVAGLRGLSWWTIPLNVDGTRNCSLWNYVWSQAGNLDLHRQQNRSAGDDLDQGGRRRRRPAEVPVRRIRRRGGHRLRGLLRPGRVLDVHPRRHLGRHQRVAPQRDPGGPRRRRGRRRASSRWPGSPTPRPPTAPTGSGPSPEPSTPRSPRSTPSPPTPCSTSSPPAAGPASCPTARPARSAGNGSPPACWPTPWPTGRGRSASSAAPAPAPIPLPGDWTVVTPGADGAIPIEALRDGEGAALLRRRGGGLPGPADLPHRPARRSADR